MFFQETEFPLIVVEKDTFSTAVFLILNDETIEIADEVRNDDPESVEHEIEFLFL